MGADLYIRKLFDPQMKKYKRQIQIAVQKRDSALLSSDKDKAQKEVDRLYNIMYSKGYWRDPYNKYEVLDKMKFSYWVDFPCLTKNVKGRRMMSPENAKMLACLLEKRNMNLRGFNAEEKEYFKKGKNELIQFLNSASKLKQSIECSI
jgi:hypothetical protein